MLCSGWVEEHGRGPLLWLDNNPLPGIYTCADFICYHGNHSLGDFKVSLLKSRALLGAGRWQLVGFFLHSAAASQSVLRLCYSWLFSVVLAGHRASVDSQCKHTCHDQCGWICTQCFRLSIHHVQSPALNYNMCWYLTCLMTKWVRLEYACCCVADDAFSSSLTWQVSLCPLYHL